MSLDLVLITGMSGSGKSVALHALEDAGYYCVDNLPPELLTPFIALQHAQNAQRVAIASYTQGQMDLGATVCLSRKPSCMLCPVNDSCVARREGSPERYPVKTRKLRRTAQSL